MPAHLPPTNISIPTMLNAAQVTQTLEDSLSEKTAYRPHKTFLLGLTGGGYVALGLVFFITSQVGAHVLPFGVAKVLGGIVFTTGLALVVLTGAELFTASTLSLTSRASGRITTSQLLRNWVLVYVANLCGALTIVCLVYFSGVWYDDHGQ
ncbi:unnamed protein product [marine sediment metagenome]|uniref:Formate/nitrite transporter n=1 Tax=marine sediment metagenome TaxID=412755 RepID=X1H134_9ZZZZ